MMSSHEQKITMFLILNDEHFGRNWVQVKHFPKKNNLIYPPGN